MSGVVQQFAHTARIGGRVVEATEISVDREIATTMPASVSGGGGIVKTTGRVTAQDPGTVVGPERQGPWASGPWPPKRYEPTELETTLDEGAPSRRLTGRVHRVSGSATGPVRIEVEDRIDDLRRPVRHDPLLATMPPIETADHDWRRVGLRPDYLANVIMRQGRYYSTPRPFGTVRCSVPTQGSLWPETGFATRSVSFPDAGGNPTWHRTPWGWAPAGADVTYGSGSGGTMAGRALSVGLMVAPDHSDVVRVDVLVSDGTDTVLTLRVTGSRRLEWLVNNQRVATSIPDAGWTRVQALHDGSRIVFRTDTGWEYSAAHTLTAALNRPYRSTRMISTPGARAGALLVGFVSTSGNRDYVTSELNAHIRPGTLLGNMWALPTISADDGLRLLQEISEACVISMWTDTAGHLWWVHPDWLANQAPAAELTSEADLLDLAWQDTADSVRSTVTVEWDDPSITRHRDHRATVWEGPGDSLGPGESVEQIATPPARTDWIMVDTTPRQMLLGGASNSNPAGAVNFRRGIGSWVGGTPMNTDGETLPHVRLEWLDDGSPEPQPDFSYVSMSWSMERIGPAAWKITQTQGHSNSPWVDVVHRLDLLYRQSSLLGTDRAGQRMPILRAKALIEWNDQESSSTIQGPPEADRLTHRAGPWVNASTASALANWLAAQTATPAPVLDALPIVWRSDLRPGQVIDVREEAIYGVRLRVLVTGIRETHTAGGSSMTLTGRVVGAWSLRWTYNDLAALGLTYAGLAAQGGTYVDLMRRGLPADVTYPTSYTTLAQQLQEDSP